jgi:hypothetical protein
LSSLFTFAIGDIAIFRIYWGSILPFLTGHLSKRKNIKYIARSILLNSRLQGYFQFKQHSLFPLHLCSFTLRWWSGVDIYTHI